MKGDREALNLFYIRFAPLMLSVIRRYVPDPEDAEDILHDGFIVAFTRLESLRDSDKVDYWLATIMKNLSLQFLHTQDLTTMLHDIPEVEEAPEIDEFIDLDTLESLIKRLPAGYQKVFRLAVLENKSHKEIARLLGIAPNSSSSQLFHAKLMMRRLIVEYKRQSGLFTVLLVAAIAGVVLWHGNQKDVSDSRHLEADNAVIEKATGVSVRPVASAAAIINTGGIVRPAVTAAADSTDIEEILPDSLITTVPDLIADSSDETEKGETTSENENTMAAVNPVPALPEEPYHAYLDDRIAGYDRGNDWFVQVNVNSGIAGFAGLSGDDLYESDSPSHNDPTDSPENPGDLQQPAAMSRSGGRRYQDYDNISHHNHLPISFSITVNKTLTERLSVESGITYTYLRTTFESQSAKSDCSWHYIGIPLRFRLSTFSSDRLRLYVSLGGEVDFPVYANAHVTPLRDFSDLRPGRFNSSLVWSLSASYGISFRLSERIDVFLEPTLQYHFNHNHEVPNTWTDSPLGLSLPVGLRFTW